jgi:STE24 endopeptidase
MGSPRFRQVTPVLLALASAEIGSRLLSPRRAVPRPVPVPPGEYFSTDDITRGARFARPQLALGLVRETTQLGVLALLTTTSRTRPRRRRRLSGRRSAQEEIVEGTLAAARTAVVMTLARMPVAVIARRRAMAVGLDTQSWLGWAADVAKALAIGGVMSSAAGGAVTALIRRYPRDWWAPAAGASVAVTGLFGTLAPVLLEPLFNDFTPLPDGPARSDVLELARAAGVRVGEVFGVDASRRTSGANAYVTGLGPTKRVVLFDTLLDRYTRDEVRVVVAHELSHVRHRDVVRAIGLAVITAPATSLAIQRLSWTLTGQEGGPVGIPELGLAVALISAPLGIVTARLSRAVERRADADALELSGSPEAFISMMRALAVQNLADVQPPRWARILLASHPPTLERIGAAVAYTAR